MSLPHAQVISFPDTHGIGIAHDRDEDNFYIFALPDTEGKLDECERILIWQGTWGYEPSLGNLQQRAARYRRHPHG